MIKNMLDKIQVYVDGALPILSAICDNIGLQKNIDEQIEPSKNERKSSFVTTGQAIKSLVMNIIVDRKPFYKIQEFYENKDIEKLLGEGIKVSHLTDDLYARALDDIHEIGPKKILTETAMSIINKYNIPIGAVHADTTSKSVYVEYDGCDDESLNITYGYSKQKRPDLKQILFGLGVTKERIVVVGDVNDGNTDDKTWNKNIIKELRNSMKNYGLPEFTYVADSACITEEMLEELSGEKNNECQIKFISRLPGNYNLEKNLKEKAIKNTDKWEEIGQISEGKRSANYKVQSYVDKLYGKKYRFIVCFSDHLNQSKESTIGRKILKEKESIKKEKKKFEKMNFYCEKDAEEAIKKFKKEHKLRYHDFDNKIMTLEIATKSGVNGRPKKGEEREKRKVYKIELNIKENKGIIEEHKLIESMFVLITGIIDEKELSNKDVLREYKEQVSVETSFKVLKDPHFMDEIFLKKPERVEALGYIMLISLMVLTLLERTVRQSLKNESEMITVSGKRKTFSPTGVSIIQVFENVQVYKIYNEKEDIWERCCNLDKNLVRIIDLLGLEKEIYVK